MSRINIRHYITDVQYCQTTAVPWYVSTKCNNRSSPLGIGREELTGTIQKSKHDNAQYGNVLDSHIAIQFPMFYFNRWNLRRRHVILYETWSTLLSEHFRLYPFKRFMLQKLIYGTNQPFSCGFLTPKFWILYLNNFADSMSSLNLKSRSCNMRGVITCHSLTSETYREARLSHEGYHIRVVISLAHP